MLRALSCTVGLAVFTLGAALSGACGDQAVTTSTTDLGGGGDMPLGGMGGETEGGGGSGGEPGADFAEPCTDDDACAPGFCILETNTGWPRGYCSELCNDLAPCSTPGTSCVDIGGGSFCLLNCAPSGGAEECQPHQQCFDLGNSAGVCGPGCGDNSDCPALGQCEADGFCVEPEDCEDGVDNDQDGRTDCEDIDCIGVCGTAIDATCAAASTAVATQAGDTSGATDLFAGSCTGNGGALEDVYGFTPGGDGLLAVALDSATDQGVYVRTTCADASTEVACADAVLGGARENLFFPVAGGTPLSLFVDGFQSPVEAGPYTLDVNVLTVTPESEDNGAFGVANALPSGNAFSGGITEADMDFIAVTVAGPASTLTAEIVAGGSNTCLGDIDSELQLLDTDGTTELAFNDDISSFGNFCSRTAASDLAAGTYFIRVAASQMFCAACTFDYNVVVTVTP